MFKPTVPQPIKVDAPLAPSAQFGLSAMGMSDWQDDEEGQLSVDVCETADELVVVALLAGTQPKDLELHLHNDLFTIRGARFSPITAITTQHSEENYWGRFSRTIILPVEIRADLVRAELKNGILTVHLPKVNTDRAIPVLVIEE